MLREYKIFTSVIYRWVIWVAYPVLACFFAIGMQNGFFGIVPSIEFVVFYPAFLLTAVMATVEIIQDFFIFGGILGKGNAHFEYLKCSARGKKVYRNALTADSIRRALTILGVHGINVLYCIFFTEETVEPEKLNALIGLACLSTFGAFFGIFVERWFNTMWTAIAISYLFNIVIMLGIMAVEIFSSIIPSIVLLALAVIAAVVTIKLAIIKLDRSYYDK